MKLHIKKNSWNFEISFLFRRKYMGIFTMWCSRQFGDSLGALFSNWFVTWKLVQKWTKFGTRQNINEVLLTSWCSRSFWVHLMQLFQNWYNGIFMPCFKYYTYRCRQAHAEVYGPLFRYTIWDRRAVTIQWLVKLEIRPIKNVQTLFLKCCASEKDFQIYIILRK